MDSTGFNYLTALKQSTAGGTVRVRGMILP